MEQKREELFSPQRVVKETPQRVCRPRVPHLFSCKAAQYDRCATMQKRVAQAICLPTILPQGEILEVGSGTGFLTHRLRAQYPEHHIQALDPSHGMMEILRQKNIPDTSFAQTFFEEYQPGHKFAAIFSSMALHWLDGHEKQLFRMLSMCKNGGILVLAFPYVIDAKRWSHLINPLPSLSLFSEFSKQEMVFQETFSTPWEFFRSYQKIGTQGNLKGCSNELRRLYRDEDPLEVETRVVIGVTHV